MFEDGRWAKAWTDTAGKAAGEVPEPPKVDDYA